MDGTTAEIRGFAGTFAPRNWAYCRGDLIAISQNQALFSLIGTQFGGDGRSTMALPNLSGRVPMGSGNGPGLTPRTQGQFMGEERVTLNVAEIPAHNHGVETSGLSLNTSGLSVDLSKGKASLSVSDQPATQDDATPGVSIGTHGTGSGRTFTKANAFNNNDPDVTLNADSVKLSGTVPVTGSASVSGGVATENNGGSQSHDNIQPSLVIHWIICMEGIYPSRS